MHLKTPTLTILASALLFSFANAGDIPKSHQKAFSEVDADANGAITKEEAAASKIKYLSPRFEDFDKDANGTIELAEFSAELTNRKAKIDKIKAARAARAAKAAEAAAE